MNRNGAVKTSGRVVLGEAQSRLDGKKGADLTIGDCVGREFEDGRLLENGRFDERTKKR